MMHIICQTKYLVRPRDFTKPNGNRCPNCSISHGEAKIVKFLEHNRLSYESEFKITECKNKRPLPFDFKIDLKNGKFILLEYDGKQHFVPTFNTKTFNRQKENDSIKTKFCEDNNIKLIRINYLQLDNIYKILKEELKGLKLQRL